MERVSIFQKKNPSRNYGICLLAYYHGENVHAGDWTAWTRKELLIRGIDFE